MEVIFTDILGVPLPREYHANVSNGDSVEDKTRKYLEQLTAETREQLYQVYKHDFLLFDYVPYWPQFEYKETSSTLESNYMTILIVDENFGMYNDSTF